MLKSLVRLDLLSQVPNAQDAVKLGLLFLGVRCFQSNISVFHCSFCFANSTRPSGSSTDKKKLACIANQSTRNVEPV